MSVAKKRLIIWAVVLVGTLIFFSVTKSQHLNSRQPTATLAPASSQAEARLAQAVQFQTISTQSGDHDFTNEFLNFHKFLQASFPLVHKNLRLKKVNNLSLLYRWQG